MEFHFKETTFRLLLVMLYIPYYIVHRKFNLTIFTVESILMTIFINEDRAVRKGKKKELKEGRKEGREGSKERKKKELKMEGRKEGREGSKKRKKKELKKECIKE
jgi:hypothetical protein